MTNVRVMPWEGIGEEVRSNDIYSALQETGLNWTVNPEKIWVGEPDVTNLREIPRYVANVRSDNGYVVGVVSDKYQITQNQEAFDFINYLTPEGLKIIKGGVINNKKVWLVGEMTNMARTSSARDAIKTYVIFTNNHDGKGSVRVCITPIRITCQNALSIAFKNADRTWSVSHVGDVKRKLYTAEQTLNLTQDYMNVFEEECEILKEKQLNKEKVDMILTRLFPLEEDPSEQREKIVLERRAIVKHIYTNAPDLGRNTAWDLVNAVSDYTNHYFPSYDEKLFRTSNFNKMIKGNSLIDHVYKLVA